MSLEIIFPGRKIFPFFPFFLHGTHPPQYLENFTWLKRQSLSSFFTWVKYYSTLEPPNYFTILFPFQFPDIFFWFLKNSAWQVCTHVLSYNQKLNHGTPNSEPKSKRKKSRFFEKSSWQTEIHVVQFKMSRGQRQTTASPLAWRKLTGKRPEHRTALNLEKWM